MTISIGKDLTDDHMDHSARLEQLESELMNKTLSRRRHDDRLGKLGGGLQDVTLMIVRQEDVIRQLVAQQKDHEAQTKHYTKTYVKCRTRCRGASSRIVLQTIARRIFYSSAAGVRATSST